MKKFLIIILSSVLLLIWTPAFSGRPDHQKYKERQHQIRQGQKQHNNRYGHNKRRVYKKKHRRSKKHKAYHRRFKYQGHRKWDRWQHERRRPKYKSGQYHITREGFLLFSYCNGGTCFAISID